MTKFWQIWWTVLDHAAAAVISIMSFFAALWMSLCGQDPRASINRDYERNMRLYRGTRTVR